MSDVARGVAATRDARVKTARRLLRIRVSQDLIRSGFNRLHGEVAIVTLLGQLAAILVRLFA